MQYHYFKTTFFLSVQWKTSVILPVTMCQFEMAAQAVARYLLVPAEAPLGLATVLFIWFKHT